MFSNIVVKSVMTSIVSRKHIRDEEEEKEEQTILIVISVVTMLLEIIVWYHDKNFVKEPVKNWELKRHGYINHLIIYVEDLK